MTHSAPATVAERLSAALDSFNNGRISETWALLHPVLDKPGLNPQEQHRRNFLQLGCALYYTGDQDAARQLNASLPADGATLPMRYRLALRQRDGLTASRLRKSAAATPKMQDDFRCSAGLYCLWNHRMRWGFHFYRARHAAINFPQILPKKLRYAPVPEDPADDIPIIALEQGVGDVVLYLAHIRQEGRHAKSTFLGLPQYRPMIERWFPEATYFRIDQLDASWEGKAVHCAADFLARAWTRQGNLRLSTPMPEQPRRLARHKPVVGICWRGGSGQNRREERHIPLPYFLDMLPRNGHFLALQFDLTDEERDLLRRDGRVMVPFADITENPCVTIDMIRSLAGVISVDSANWHFAGISDVPFLAIMNRTSHWFWGTDAKAENTYPSGHTVPKTRLNAAAIEDWMRDAVKKWRKRSVGRIPKTDKPAEKPLFVVSLPRSRSSMTMRILASQGVWTGRTVGPTSANPHGFFENQEIREVYLKGILKDLGADPLGVSPLPRTEQFPPYPHLQRQILERIEAQGYDGIRPWGFKDPKLALVWPIFAEAFPNAHWLILNRPVDKVIDSLCRTPFMARHSTSPEYWSVFCATQLSRLDMLRNSGLNVWEADTDQLLDGEMLALAELCDELGLRFDKDKAMAAVDRSLR